MPDFLNQKCWRDDLQKHVQRQQEFEATVLALIRMPQEEHRERIAQLVAAMIESYWAGDEAWRDVHV